MSNLFKQQQHHKMLTSHRNILKEIILSFPSKFQRRRQFGPMQVILTLIASHFGLSVGQGQSWTDAMTDVAILFGWAFGWVPGASFSRNTFHKARKKLTRIMMRDLWNHTTAVLSQQDQMKPLVRIHGLRFIHVDGSQFHTARSPELLRELGVQTNGKNKDSHYPSGQLVTAIESGTSALLGIHLTRCKKKDTLNQSSLKMGERSGLEELMYLQGKNDCLVADAGFLSYKFMYNMEQQKRLYIIGAAKNWNFVKAFMRAKQAERVVTITVPDTHADRSLCGKTMRIRIVSIKGSQGAKKYIITNIMKEELTLSEIRKVYKQRWSIEIFFRHIKTYLGMRHLRSQTLIGVEQEIFAVMLLMRLTAHVQSTITCAVNKITNTLDIFTEKFKKTRLHLSLKYTWMLMHQSFYELTEREFHSLSLLWDALLRNMQEYMPGRSAERISHAISPCFRKERPLRSERKRSKKQGK